MNPSRSIGSSEKYTWTGVPAATARSISSAVPDTAAAVGVPRRVSKKATTTSARSTACRFVNDA
ncbi:hypothetical protein [Luteimicrobium subarcticum]|uniref:hypothetical protein n=1 Tax=Luteimicrobium subarcticum TaxID=620910 RepID=UPI0012FD8EFE|nr:hypothetical protein [Luteimicrobium subarcticum]